MTTDERIENCENAIYRLCSLLQILAQEAEDRTGMNLSLVLAELRKIKENI